MGAQDNDIVTDDRQKDLSISDSVELDDSREAGSNVHSHSFENETHEAGDNANSHFQSSIVSRNELMASVIQVDDGVERIPMRIDFRNIEFSVTTKKDETEIIKNVSGCAKPGEFLAILGASGAGKTSLLNVLASRIPPKPDQHLSGRVLINARSCEASVVQDVTAYVMQDDILFSSFTVREAIEFSANLRLSKAMSNQSKMVQVDAIIELLGLTKCQSTQIGKGISGGERKRVSIAVELVTNPGLLLLDEPTSGLDSFTSLRLIQLLSALASGGRTVISTIHQPNSDMWAMFDKVCLMANGHIVYLGPRDKAVEYFADLGYRCPQFVNPSDYFLSILSSETPEDLQRIESLAAEHRSRSNNHIDLPAAEDITHQRKIQAHTAAGCSFFCQFRLLMVRATKNVIREPSQLQATILMALFFAILFGLVFFQIPRTERGVQDRAGAIFMLVTNAVFGSVSNVVLTFPMEKLLFQRERANNMYSTPAYFSTKFIAELPVKLVVQGMFVAIVYPMMDLAPGFKQWITMFAIMAGLLICGYGFGLMIGALAPNPEVASMLVPIVIMPQILLAE
eukprot:946809_1